MQQGPNTDAVNANTKRSRTDISYMIANKTSRGMSSTASASDLAVLRSSDSSSCRPLGSRVSATAIVHAERDTARCARGSAAQTRATRPITGHEVTPARQGDARGRH